MPSSRRSSSAADRAERMVSHNRYTSEQKRFFAVHLRLWNQKKISKDEVIERFKKQFNDQKFGYSQYRYLRQEVGRDVEFGAPLLQIQEQNALVTAPRPAPYAQGFPSQQPQTASAPQAFYEDTFSAPVADSSPFLQQQFSSGYDDFPDLKMLAEDGVETTPAPVAPSTLGSTAFMSAQQQQQQYQQQPEATDAFKCSGGGPCTIPLGAPHRHELDGSIVFPNEKAVVGMVAMEKLLVGMDNIDPQINSTNSEPPVSSCSTGSGYTFTTSAPQQDTFTAAPANQNIKNDEENNLFARLEYGSPLLQDPSTEPGTTTGGMKIDSRLTDMVFEDDMFNQICNNTSHGMAGGADAMYRPTSMAAQYPFLQHPAQNPRMPAAKPSDTSFNYTESPTGLPNWSQGNSYHLAPSTQAGITPSPSSWTSQHLGRMNNQQPGVAMTIPRRGVGTGYAPTATRRQQTRDAGFGLDLGAGGMQTAYPPVTIGILPSTPAVAPPSMWSQNESPAGMDSDVGAAAASKASQSFDIQGVGGTGTPQ
ncbi:hypothetical protein PspLS_04407 [Pyricularia sp. CBS 133598]|nr:hypothetical protein PspLS_04407 [Pyricularia sp. CBS 133598]